MKNEKQDGIIYARVPGDLRDALERERLRMSKAAGAEVKTSAVLRAILNQVLLPIQRRSKTEAR